MYRRYRDYRQRRRRNTNRRPRSVLKRPGVQISILLIVALVIYLILQSGGAGGNNLPRELGVRGAYSAYPINARVPGIHAMEVGKMFSDAACCSGHVLRITPV
jgi:hypothetical protein